MRRRPRRIPWVGASLLVVAGCAEAERPSTAAAQATSTLDTLLDVGGTRLFVHAEGAGEAVLVVHGGPLLDHGYLVAPLRPLADRYRLVFFDQRLSGRSDGTVDSASVRLDTLVADVERVREALGLQQVHVLAHSWGGLLALRYALAHPDRTRSLVLVSPIAPSAELRHTEQARLAEAREPEDTAGIGAARASEAFARGEPAAIERLLQLFFRGQLADPGLADSLRFLIPPDYGQRSRQLSFMAADLLDYDLTPALPALRVPTLIVYGAAEPAASVGADTLRALLPSARISRTDEAGHFAFLEQSAVFLASVRTFLESTRN